MTRRDVAYGGCLALGGMAGMFAAFYAFFLASTPPESWLRRHCHPH